ncbi:sarcosine oxidase subunit alpha family protein [Roseibium denhamense]|uniref:N-methylglutamate dehydrogenase subunit C n=1 Tax=Roseibium denhamense TaxID=76305 RepID=A0ABY1PNA4_9HYPH|nr:sarcosine oxidase subunit alpha family protein [Roseibium denhamense]MTI04334.1 sarcosine oxidase subunit alpha family protein [Roseibium denhamense]SMP37218.1 N-methylglutamate dehydrogenase subunit C [Roseibium denhamense]
MSQLNRLSGGLIDRSSPLTFTFDGRGFSGFKGDTLASALLANNVRLMGRSFKYHRPRGVVASGSEEPNALVEVRSGPHRDPNTRATVAELFDGLSAVSQNRWPSLSFDAMGINDAFSSFLTAGFYYKTFMWPKAFWEKVYEPVIRRAAGLGALSMEPDLDTYDKGFLHCDLLVIGAGPAGLAAALTGARSGTRVVLADEDFEAGGRLTSENMELNGKPATEWLAAALEELRACRNVRILSRTTVYGAYDHGVYGALERVSDHLGNPDPDLPRQILWRIYSRQAVLCAGATERPIAFENNDRPGIMLAGAMRAYANRWAAAASTRIAVFTNNDDGHRTARDLLAKGVDVAAVVDVRPDAPKTGDYELLAGASVVDAGGRLGLKEIQVRLAGGSSRQISCGALGVSGGWNPAVSLTSHQRGRPVWQDDIAAFVPGPSLPSGMSVAGAANGRLSTHGAFADAAEKAAKALAAAGFQAIPVPLPVAEDSPVAVSAVWHTGEGKGRAWLDFQNDVTVKDVRLAHQEGFKSVEHLKRYTTLGMATDQGKLSNLGGLAVMAELTGKSIQDTGTTIFRPPYTSVPIAAFAGRSRGEEFRPVRHTPSHRWAEEQGAVFVEAGMWLRAQWFPREGETHWRQSVDREVLAVRKSVGVCDVTTLGKVDVQGADAAQFLNKVYCNGFTKLPVGKVRYGLMLREDGMAMDDGTAARLAEDHYVVTTTTANAVSVYRHMEFVRQCLCPDLDVQLISTTEAWAQYAVAGPNSRALLCKLVDPKFDLSNEEFPFMACGEITICGGVRARLFRISFSGELAYELAVPARYGDNLMRALMTAGKDFNVTPYGTEALGVLRIEKGHAAGNELNGQTSAAHLGMDRMVSTKKDSIGAVLSRREGLCDADGWRLIGLEAVEADVDLPAGGHLFERGKPQQASNDEGWITSAAYSPHLEKSIALGYLLKGDQRFGEEIEIANPVQGAILKAKVVSPHFIDPEGERLRG